MQRWTEVDLLEGPWQKNDCSSYFKYSLRLQVFLLFEGLDREQWSKKLDESRDAYSALRAHFLKYIEHPDDLESSADPLADDEEVCLTRPVVNEEALQRHPGNP